MSFPNPVLQYLTSFINKKECTKKLINMFLEHMKCRSGAIFICNNSPKYICIDHVSREENIDFNIVFNPPNHMNETVIYKDGKCEHLKVHYETKNIVLIPIMVHDEKIGLIILLNFDCIIHIDKLIRDMTPYITITQLVLNKHKLIKDYKDCYSENNCFSKDLFWRI